MGIFDGPPPPQLAGTPPAAGGNIFSGPPPASFSPPPPQQSPADGLLTAAKDMVLSAIPGVNIANQLGLVSPGAAGAALTHAAEAASFGLADRGAAAIQYGAANIPGLNTLLGNSPITWEQANANIHNGLEQQHADYPVASDMGTLGGTLMGGTALVKGLGAAAKVAPRVIGAPLEAMLAPATATDATLPLAARMGTMSGNVARAAAAGAVTSGIANEAQQPNADSRLGLAMATGAVGGPILGKAVGLVGEKLAPLFINLINKMGGSLDSPDAVAAAKALLPVVSKMPEAQRATVLGKLANDSGAAVPLVAATTPTEGAAANALATRYPAIAAGLQGEQAAVQQAQPQALAGVLSTADATGSTAPTSPRLATVPGTSAAPVQDVLALTSARNANMDAARVTAAKAGADWATTRVPLTTEDLSTLTRKSVRAALQGSDETGALLNRYNKAIADLTDENGNPVAGATSNRLTVDDIDNIRQTVGQYANAAENSHRAGSINESRDMVADLATRSSPTYAGALKNYRSDSDYVRGFKLAEAGKEASKVEAGNPAIKGMETPEFKAGQASGLKARLVGQAGESNAGAATTAQALSENAGPQARITAAMGPTVAARMGAAGTAQKTVNEAMANVTPPVGHIPDTGIAGKVGAGVAAGAIGMTKTAAAQFMGAAKSLIGQSDLSQMQQKMALDMLLTRDPAKQRQVLAYLTQAGVNQTALKSLQSMLGAIMVAPMATTEATGRR